LALTCLKWFLVKSFYASFYALKPACLVVVCLGRGRLKRRIAKKTLMDRLLEALQSGCKNQHPLATGQCDGWATLVLPRTLFGAPCPVAEAYIAKETGFSGFCHGLLILHQPLSGGQAGGKFCAQPDSREIKQAGQSGGLGGGEKKEEVPGPCTWLLVDGRYRLQAQQQAPKSILVDVGQGLAGLIQGVASGTTVLVDPWALSCARAELLTSCAKERGLHLRFDLPLQLDAQIQCALPDRMAAPPETLPQIPPQTQGLGAAMGDLWFLPLGASLQEKTSQIAVLAQRPTLLCVPDDVGWLTGLRDDRGGHIPAPKAYGLVLPTDDAGPGSAVVPPTQGSVDAEPQSPARSLPKQDQFSVCVFLEACPQETAMAAKLAIPQGIHLAPLAPLLDKGIGLPASVQVGGEIGYDPDTTPYGLLCAVRHWPGFKDVRWIAQEALSKFPVRLCKTTAEITASQQAHSQEGVALVRLLAKMDSQALSQGWTEADVVDQLEILRRQSSTYRCPSFATIAASGAHSAMIHYRPDRQRPSQVEPGLFLLDAGGQYRFGTTDLTRTLWLGPKAPTQRHRDLYTCVLQAHIHLACARFPVGTRAHQLDTLARGWLWQEGLDYAHATGHGVGFCLNVHEAPAIGSTQQSQIHSGMILSDEPGYYEEGWGGIRLENLLWVHGDAAVENPSMGNQGRDQAVYGQSDPGKARPERLAFTPLSFVPFERSLIEAEKLTHRQRHWLDAYHQEVFDLLAPQLDEGERHWLDLKTKPLEL
jgi:Xaa-Pro aminopeptidase